MGDIRLSGGPGVPGPRTKGLPVQIVRATIWISAAIAGIALAVLLSPFALLIAEHGRRIGAGVAAGKDSDGRT